MKLSKLMLKIIFFDVVTNSIGLAAALLAQAYVWWLDPIGAIL